MPRNRMSLTDSLNTAVERAMPKKETAAEAPAAAQKTAPKPTPVSDAGADVVTGQTEEEPADLDTASRAADDLAREKAKRQRQQRAAQDDRVDLGIYLTAETYDEMKAAYLSDWANRRGDADTLYRWVADALSAHVARSVAERSKIAPAEKKRAKTRTGNPRAFKVPADVYARTQDAIAADQKAERWLSESAWNREAITHAIAAARAANGGTLPEPPVRLPNRLKRRD